MKIRLEVEIDEASIDLSSYDTVPHVKTYEDAINYDLGMYRDGEISLEDLAYTMGEVVEVSLKSVTFTPDNVNNYNSDGEVVNYEDGE